MIIKFIKHNDTNKNFDTFVFGNVKDYEVNTITEDNKEYQVLSVVFNNGEKKELKIKDIDGKLSKNLYYGIYAIGDSGATLDKI